MSTWRSTNRLIAMGVGAAGFLIAGCGADESDVSKGISNDITGSVSEWSVELDADGAMAGEVTFSITNSGTIDHEFLVIKTDFPVGEIPLVNDRFEEDAEGIEVIDEIPEFPKGETETLTVDLAPGNYQFVCNIAGHYAAGMHTGFIVE